MDIRTIKEKIFTQVSSIEDVNFLEAIGVMLDYKFDSSTIKISKKMKFELDKGRESIIKGNYISHEDMKIEMTQWLDK